MSLHDDIEKLAPELRRFARALVQQDPGEPHDTADALVRETMVRALRSKRNAPFASTRIKLYATLAGLNQARRHAPARAERAGRGLDSVPTISPHAGGRSQGITRALAALPLEEREAVLLVVLERLTYAQAADVLGVPRAVLAARVVRARQFLSEHLDAALPIEVRNRVRYPQYLRVVK